MSKMTLTGDDLAVAQFACAHAMDWCKKQGRRKWWRDEHEKFRKLNAKLSAISDFAYPATEEDFPSGTGHDEVMRADMRMIRRLRRIARAS